jgi:hypothetical protein
VSQRRLSLSTTLYPGRKCVEASDHVIKSLLRNLRTLSRRFPKKPAGFKMRATALTQPPLHLLGFMHHKRLMMRADNCYLIFDRLILEFENTHVDLA